MSHISLKIIKEADERRGPLKTGPGYYARLQLAIMQYDAFRARQVASVYEDRREEDGKAR